MSKIKEIEQETIKRYSDRYKDLGKNVRTLGWGSDAQQEYRFLQVVKNVDFSKKSVLDIGCGFGDLFSFLKVNSIEIEKYVGFDINRDLIVEAKKVHKDGEFFLGNVLEQEDAICDIGVMLGVLNFNLKEKMDNLEYSKNAIKRAFNLVNETLVVDFLSSYLTPTYEREEQVFYHSPLELLEFAFTLTPNVKLIHNYKPIPQKEFLLILEK